MLCFFVYFSLKHQSAQRSSLEQLKCSGNFLNTWSVLVFRACADISDNFTAIDDCNKRDRKTWSHLTDSFLSHGSVVKISPLSVLRCSHMTIVRDLYKPTLVFLQPFLEHVLMWILLQVCLHHKVTDARCWGAHVVCASLCPWIRGERAPMLPHYTPFCQGREMDLTPSSHWRKLHFLQQLHFLHQPPE